MNPQGLEKRAEGESERNAALFRSWPLSGGESLTEEGGANEDEMYSRTSEIRPTKERLGGVFGQGGATRAEDSP